MPMTETKIKQWGNSLALIIPKEIAKLEDLNVGDTVKVDISKEKRVDAFGMLKGVPRFCKEDEGDIVKVEISKEKRVDGFGMFKGIPKFKEDKEDHW